MRGGGGRRLLFIGVACLLALANFYAGTHLGQHESGAADPRAHGPADCRYGERVDGLFGLFGCRRDSPPRNGVPRFAHTSVNRDHIPDVFALGTKVGPPIDPLRRRHDVARMTPGTTGVRPAVGCVCHEPR